MERTWRDRRKRYRVAGADETGKLKRFGIGAPRLRAAMARVLAWFRLCLRHGWIEGYEGEINYSEPHERNGNDMLLTLWRTRRLNGLDIPYGPVATALGIALDDSIPPWIEPKNG
jgi:hypothetical protein